MLEVHEVPVATAGNANSIAIDFLRSIGKPELMLDVGCGAGSFGAILKGANAVTTVYGVDSSRPHIEEARHTLDRAQVCDLEAEPLPFADGTIDVVTLLEVVEHIRDLQLLKSEICRVMKPEGHLIVSTPNIQCGYHILRLILGHGPQTSFSRNHEYTLGDHYDSGHVHYFTERDLSKLLGPEFHTLSRRGTWYSRSPLLRRLCRLLSATPLRRYASPGIVILARRAKPHQ